MFLKEEFLPHIRILDFLEHTLIVTKCLALFMFELRDVYYIYLMLIILYSRCFSLKSFLRSSKLINKGIYTSSPRILEISWMSYALLIFIEFFFHFGFLWCSSFVINFTRFSSGFSGRWKSSGLDITRTIIKFVI